MTRSSRRNKHEEALRLWAGRVLTGAAPAPPVEDPARLRAFRRYHGIEPLLARNQADGESMKHAVAAELARRTEFVRGVRALQAGDRPAPIIIKGQALAYSVYPDPWLRTRTDIDVLVDDGAMEPAATALADLGYRRSGAIDADLVLPQVSLSTRRHGLRHTWDIHQRVSNRPALARAAPYEQIRLNAVRIPVEDTGFFIPSRVDNLLIACLHLVGHHPGEMRLIWLYDIRLLAAALNESEQRLFLDRAAGSPPVRAACHAALAQTQHYFPGDNTDLLRRSLDAGAGAGARWRTSQLYLARVLEDAIASGRGRRLQYLRQQLFPSAGYMMKRYRIRQRWQLPLWYALRIARALPKLLRRR